MDASAFLKREMDYTKVWATAGLSLAMWLLPKAFKAPVAWELALGIGATSAMLTAAHEVGKLEKKARYERAEQAANQDLFSTELAYAVYLKQLELHAQLPTQRPQMHPAQQPLTPSRKAVKGNAPIQPVEPEVLDLDELTHYPAVIVFGPQGSGKTTLASAIALHRARHGHQIEVLDPHGSPWDFPVTGSGMDYEAIGERVRDILDELIQRYRQLGKGDTAFFPWTLICDEFTNWAHRIDAKLVLEFLRTCWTDIRKVRVMAIFISHTNTLEGGLAGAKGLAVLRDSGCVQIQLFAEIAPATGQARPTGQGKLYRPGMDPVDIVIPPLQHSAAIQRVNRVNAQVERSECLPAREFSGFSQAIQNGLNVQNGPMPHPFSWLHGEKLIQMMQAIATDQPKHKSIEQTLGVKPGGSEQWQRASRDWDQAKAMMR